VSSFWLLLCAYAIVAATTLLHAEIRPAAGAKPSQTTLCLCALLFAAAWPIRAVAGAIDWITR
jgi:hypothetical protein